jgi:hypothetical protein
LRGGIRQANHHTPIEMLGIGTINPTGVDATNLSYGRLLALI